MFDILRLPAALTTTVVGLSPRPIPSRVTPEGRDVRRRSLLAAVAPGQEVTVRLDRPAPPTHVGLPDPVLFIGEDTPGTGELGPLADGARPPVVGLPARPGV